jgi:hypothetical protein
VTKGVEYVSIENGHLVFHRFSPEEEKVINSVNVAHAAGVQMEFKTDAKRLKLKIATRDESGIRFYFAVDIFENGELLRLREPKNYLYEMPYHIRRKEIDLNGHLHNLCYLDIALEALPDDVYHSRDFKDIRITYRKEIKADEKDIACKYTEENGTHIVGIYGNNGTLRAIVALS